jgi:hypothetical protein
MVQQNLFNLTSSNLAFEDSSPKTRRSAFYQYKSFIMKQADLKDMFKNVSKNIYTLTDPLSPILSPSSAVMMPENTQEHPDDREPADKGGVQMVHLLYLNMSSLVWFLY